MFLIENIKGVNYLNSIVVFKYLLLLLRIFT